MVELGGIGAAVEEGSSIASCDSDWVAEGWGKTVLVAVA